MSFAASTHAKAAELTRMSHEMTAGAGSGHPTSAAGLAHLVTVLLYHRMRYSPEDPAHPAADRLVLSEGHACPIVYAAAADLGISIGRRGERRAASRPDLARLRAIDGELDGHPNPAEGFPLFPAATGSLGQGLSLATGIALAARLDGLPKRIYCLIGDAESREGQIWEALDFLVDQSLLAVCPVFNMNGYGQTGPVSDQQSAGAVAAKLAGFGLEVVRIDGHDPEQIRDAFARHDRRAGEPGSAPVAIVARTVKGWGTPSLRKGEGAGHGRPANGRELETAVAELRAEVSRRRAGWTDGDIERAPFEALDPPEDPREPLPDRLPGLAETLLDRDRGSVLEERRLATRKAFGLALRAAGPASREVVVLDGDVANSTGAGEFRDEADLAARFLPCGVAEQHMVSCATGLAVSGKVPVAVTFGKFLERTCDQVGMALVSRANVKFVGSHTGVTPAADGPSQMALADAAFFRALSEVDRDGTRGPALYVLTPSDAFAACRLTHEMLRHDGPCYLRLQRPDVLFLADDDTPFPLGGHRLVADGGDVVLAAWGYMVHEALRARELLEELGVRAAVLDLYSLPFDGREVAALVRERGGRVVTVEDNFAGGPGAAVAEALAGDGARHERMTARRIPKSGRTPADVLDRLELSAEHVAERAVRMVR